jgi:signal transduction histidine kinase
VYADPDRIKQVLMNLIANAFDALAGRTDGRVVLSARALGDSEVEVTVVDNGPGIDPSVASRVFRSFVTTKEAGTGLGLAIVKSIVERHGGAVALESAQGGGTVARFTLPRA